MTNAQRSANRLRRIILVVGIFYTLGAICWLVLPWLNEVLLTEFVVAGALGTPVAPVDTDEIGYANSLAVFLGLLLLTQWAFLRPGRLWTARLTATARPLKSAVIAASAMAMLLTVGLIALLLELPDWWQPIVEDTDEVGGLAVFWGSVFMIWGVWAWIFYVYWRQGDRYTQLGRMIRGLLNGSLLEATVAIPVHIWATRQRECYCVRGTYTTLIFCGTVLLWAFGPGIVLLYMRERHRRVRLFPLCTKCGYDPRASGELCPECGTPVPQETC